MNKITESYINEFINNMNESDATIGAIAGGIGLPILQYKGIKKQLEKLENEYKNAKSDKERIELKCAIAKLKSDTLGIIISTSIGGAIFGAAAGNLGGAIIRKTKIAQSLGTKKSKLKSFLMRNWRDRLYAIKNFRKKDPDAYKKAKKMIDDLKLKEL